MEVSKVRIVMKILLGALFSSEDTNWQAVNLQHACHIHKNVILNKKHLGALNLKRFLHACGRLADSDGFIHASHQHIRDHARRPHVGDVVLPAERESLSPGSIELHDTPQRKLIVASDCLVNAYVIARGNASLPLATSSPLATQRRRCVAAESSSLSTIFTRPPSEICSCFSLSPSSCHRHRVTCIVPLQSNKKTSCT